jgi:hypothetical protein
MQRVRWTVHTNAVAWAVEQVDVGAENVLGRKGVHRCPHCHLVAATQVLN